jgi:hypothetical protein
MLKYLTILLFVLTLISCQEVFIPEVDDPEPFLIIEGSVSTIPGYHQVTLMWSSKFSHNPAFHRIDNANIYLEDRQGNRTYFYRINSGVYQTDSLEIFAAVLGETYTLTVELDNGNIYRSKPQTVVECPDVKSLYCRYARESILTENAYGEAYEIPFDGISSYTSTDGLFPYNNYYFYRYVGYEQHKTIIRIGVNSYYLYGHRRLSGKYARQLLIGNADDYGNNALRDKKLIFIAKDDLYTYVPPLPDTIEILSTQFEGLLFRLRQYSLSPDAFDFWHDAENQLEAKGRLFDPVAPQLHGNMYCVNDSLQKVVGIFSASDVKEQVSYFYIDRRNHIYTKELESMPNLILDTLMWGRPEDWVDIPF